VTGWQSCCGISSSQSEHFYDASLPYNAVLRILISAGEASGEMYGAELIEALRRAAVSQSAHGGTDALVRPAGGSPAGAGNSTDQGELRSNRTDEASVPPQSPLEFFGVGGERMRAAGCDTVVDAKDLAVVGITEILSRLPQILGRYRHLIQEADRRKPDLAIVIDSPAFNWRVARQMKRRGVPTVYYVAPQFWAWRQGRVRLLRDYIDKALVIFPFEEKFYRERGVDATFVGHPLAELTRPAIEREDYAAQFQLDPSKQWITLMPGSRVKEVRMNLPTILESAALLGDQYEYLLPVAPTLEPDFLRGIIEPKSPSLAEAASSPVERTARLEAAPSQSMGFQRMGEDRPSFRMGGAGGVTLVPDSLPALFHSRAGIVASGTATVEAAMMNTPFVMVYRVSPLTYALGKPRVKVPRFAMVNLIAQEEVVPELVQRDFTAEKVVARMKDILPDGPARDHMLDGLGRVKARLRAPQEGSAPVKHPADRAAEMILALLPEH
jgi:lipid-A-disaccharide synthase